LNYTRDVNSRTGMLLEFKGTTK